MSQDQAKWAGFQDCRTEGYACVHMHYHIRIRVVSMGIGVYKSAIMVVGEFVSLESPGTVGGRNRCMGVISRAAAFGVPASRSADSMHKTRKG